MNNNIQYREDIEWQNIWWEQANETKVKRIALLGDSVTRGYRSKLNTYLEEYVVDLCASSSQITDPLLWREFKFFLDCSEWKYSKIILQAGGQHGHARRCCDDKEYEEIFRNSYMELVKKIVPYCSDILIVSSTPCVEKDELSKWDVYRNKELEIRNKISEQVANEISLPYINIWKPLIKAKYEFKDYIHMKTEGNEFMAEYLSKFCG